MTAKRSESGGKERDGEYIGTTEAATELGVDRSTLRRWINEGRIEARRVGKQWRLRRSGLAALVEVRDAGSAAPTTPSSAEALHQGRKVLDKALAKRGVKGDSTADTLRDIEEQMSARVERSDPEARKIVAAIAYQAIRDKASDVHVEPMRKELKVRYRVDGKLYEFQPLPAASARAVVDEIMLWADMDPARRHLPQDGRFGLQIDGREIDFRVNVMPGNHGSIACFRLLDRAVALVTLDRGGLEPDQLERYRSHIHASHGAIVVTSPTGCGKTTTIYASLCELNRPDRKIMSVEDPIEYDLDGVDQIPIRPDVGFDFPQALRSMLRQAPNIINVGEIRNAQTAQIVCQTALTGHLVFTTLHTDDAIGGLLRMVDIGIPPFLVVDSVRCMVAQRLPRLVCGECKAPYEASDKELDALGLKGEDRKRQLFAGKGCDHCNGTGYHGRTAVYEVLTVDRDMLGPLAAGDTRRLKEVARSHGWQPLREVALKKLFRGETTVEEVIQATATE